MLVPAAVVKLNKTHVALGQTSGEQAICSIRAGLARVRPVHLEDRVGFFGKVHEIGHRSLHAVGHLILRDAGFDLRIAVSIEPHLVQLGERVEHAAARFPADARRVIQIQHRLGARSKPDSLVLGRQKTIAPQPRKQRLVRVECVRLRDQHDKRGQVLILTAQAIGDPRAHAGTAGLLKPGLDKRDGRVVVDGVCVHRLDDGDVVDNFGGVRQAVR